MSRIIQDRATGRRAERSSPSMSTRRTVLKKKAWTRKGVSDIIGNILILAITVTLFTSILWFVSSMPGPAEKVYTDFTKAVSFDQANGTAYISITHKGGASLESYRTNIYLFIDNTPQTLHLTDGKITSPSWSTGTTWTWEQTGLSANPAISVMIVDTEANTVVWTSPLLGDSQSSMNNPIIGDRGMTPKPTIAGDQVSFWVRITDFNNNLNPSSVYLNASSIGAKELLQMTDPDGDNVYWLHTTMTADLTWDGKVVFITASDKSGNALEPARMVLSVQRATGGGGGGGNPYGNNTNDYMNGTYPSDATGGQAGGVNGITFYYIKNAAGEITNKFSPGEQVFVEVWSDTLANIQRQNTFSLWHPSGVKLSPPSSDSAFKLADSYLDFRKYTYTFYAPGTSVDPNGNNYPVQIIIRDSLGHVVNIVDQITTKTTSGSGPELQTYKVVNNVLTPTTTFNHTDTVYLAIKTNDVDSALSTVYVSDVEISDYTGNYIIKKAPPASSGSTVSYSEPLSSVFKTNGQSPDPLPAGTITSGTVYTIKIVLRDAYQGWWLPNTNDYSMKITSFRDTGTSGTAESYNLLSTQIKITAPISTTDLAATIGSGSFTWSSSGATWENNAIAWFKGGDQWNQNIIDASPNQGPIAIELADINGDGRNDVIVGSQDPTASNLYWYQNNAIDGSKWSSAIPIMDGPFDAYVPTNKQINAQTTNNGWWSGGTSRGLANEDASVYSSYVGGSFVYSYTTVEGWSTVTHGPFYQQYEICAAIGVGDFDGDGDGDIVASFIHVVVYTTASDANNVDYSNSFGMYFNRGIYVFWNDGDWTMTPLYSTDAWKADGTIKANDDSNPAAMDLAVADFDMDGYPDIVAVYETGETKVWMNQWYKQSGTLEQNQMGAFGQGSYRGDAFVPKVEGTKPWDHVQYNVEVQAGDVNGDGYPDIVRTTTAASSGTKYVYVFFSQVHEGDIVDAPFVQYVADGETAAAVSGTLDYLKSTSSPYLTLTEQNVLYPSVNAITTAKGTDDDTGGATSAVEKVDSVCYSVAGGTTMHLKSFQPPTLYSSSTVGKAYLKLTYSSDYTGTNPITYYDGTTWRSTEVIPVAGQNVTVLVDITDAMLNYGSLLNNLQIKFVNDDNNADHAVRFDCVVVQVEFVKSQGFSWVFEIKNEISAYHTLTMWARTSGEAFKVEYSLDNASWFPLTTITSTADKQYTFDLFYTQSDRYWVRITDMDRTPSDTIKNVLYLDQLTVNHANTTITWPSTSDYKKQVMSISGNDWKGHYFTGLAIGDMNKELGTLSSDSLVDIVVGTSRVLASSSGTTYALYIIEQSSPKSFSSPYAVDTNTLAVMCPEEDLYDIHGVELGDVDGDSDLDIILIVGASFGRSPGPGPTMWLYTNNNAGPSGKLVFTEEPINSLTSRGESVITLTTGNVDLTILLPFAGVLGIVVTGTMMERTRRRKR